MCKYDNKKMLVAISALVSLNLMLTGCFPSKTVDAKQQAALAQKQKYETEHTIKKGTKIDRVGLESFDPNNLMGSISSKGNMQITEDGDCSYFYSLQQDGLYLAVAQNNNWITKATKILYATETHYTYQKNSFNGKQWMDKDGRPIASGQFDFINNMNTVVQGPYVLLFEKASYPGAQQVRVLRFNADGGLLSNYTFPLDQSKFTVMTTVTTTQGYALLLKDQSGSSKKLVLLNQGRIIPFKDKYSLVNTPYFVNIEDARLYFSNGGTDKLEALDMKSGEPLYDTNGQDRILALKQGDTVDSIRSGSKALVIRNMTAKELILTTYDKDLLHPSTEKFTIPDHDTKYDIMTESTKQFHFWIFGVFERKPSVSLFSFDKTEPLVTNN